MDLEGLEILVGLESVNVISTDTDRYLLSGIKLTIGLIMGRRMDGHSKTTSRR